MAIEAILHSSTHENPSEQKETCGSFIQKNSSDK